MSQNDDDETTLKIDEYRSALCAAVLCAKTIKQYNVPQLLRDIERADAFGPLFQPTLWKDRSKAMLEDKALLEAALPLWRMAEKLEALQAAKELSSDGKA